MSERQTFDSVPVDGWFKIGRATFQRTKKTVTYSGVTMGNKDKGAAHKAATALNARHVGGLRLFVRSDTVIAHCDAPKDLE